MRITKEDVEIKTAHVNSELAKYNKPFRIKFSFRNNYYVLERDDTYGVLVAGTKRELYQYLSAMLNGIDFIS